MVRPAKQYDHVQAARSALAREQQGAPRSRGMREVLRQVMTTRQAVLVSRTKAINEVKSLIVVAPEHLREQLRGCRLVKQLTRIEQLISPPGAAVEHRVTVLTLRSIAARIRFLLAQTAELDPELLALVKQHPAGPALAEPGVGSVTAAQLLISWSHRGRVRNEAALRRSRRRRPHWKPAAANGPGTDSTAAATATSTEPFTPSRSHGCAATPRPTLTQTRPSPDASAGGPSGIGRFLVEDTRRSPR